MIRVLTGDKMITGIINDQTPYPEIAIIILKIDDPNETAKSRISIALKFSSFKTILSRNFEIESKGILISNSKIIRFKSGWSNTK